MKKPPSTDEGTNHARIHQYDLMFSFRTASSSWPEFSFLYCERQVSRLIALTLRLPSRSPSGFQPQFANYGDEFVPDSHLFPFSPDIFCLTPYASLFCSVIFRVHSSTASIPCQRFLYTICNSCFSFITANRVPRVSASSRLCVIVISVFPA